MREFLDTYKKVVFDAFAQLDYKQQETYEKYLAQTYFYTKHSVPLLRLAYPFCKNEKVRQAYVEHISEESGHENLARNDLRKISSRHPKDFEESILTKTIYYTGYKSVCENPTSFVGYIAALEFIAIWVYPDWIKELNQIYGSEATRFVHEHAVADIEHTEIMIDLYNSMGKADQEETKVVCHGTFIAYLKMINSLGLLYKDHTNEISPY